MSPTAAGMKQMLGTGAATNSFDDIEHAASFLVCGCNPTENHPVVGARIHQAVLRGAPLIVVDPRVTELAAIATVHLRPRPGTNIPLLNAMAQVILEEGLADAAWLSLRATGPDGYLHVSSGEWRAPEVGRGRAPGVPADQIRQAARTHAMRRPSMCFHGLGVTEHVQGTDGVMALVNLALLTGNLGLRCCSEPPARAEQCPGFGPHGLRARQPDRVCAAVGRTGRHSRRHGDPRSRRVLE